MDDFYAACQEKVQNATEPAAAINELASISLHDLPKVQICKFAEQSVTLLSVICQITTCSPKNLITEYKRVRQQLEMTLNYMEQIMEMEKELPPPRSDGGGCWW